MGKRPKLEALDYLFDMGTDFRLTDSEYEKETGVSLPKENSYLMKKSALSKFAEERGYIIEDIQEEGIIKRTVLLSKKQR